MTLKKICNIPGSFCLDFISSLYDVEGTSMEVQEIPWQSDSNTKSLTSIPFGGAYCIILLARPCLYWKCRACIHIRCFIGFIEAWSASETQSMDKFAKQSSSSSWSFSTCSYIWQHIWKLRPIESQTWNPRARIPNLKSKLRNSIKAFEKQDSKPRNPNAQIRSQESKPSNPNPGIPNQ